MQNTHQEEKQALGLEFDMLSRMQQVIPSTKKLGERLCRVVDSYAREHNRAVHEVEFGEVTWDANGLFRAQVILKDQYSLVTYKPPKKPWYQFSSLKVMHEQGFEQVTSFLFGLGDQLLAIVRSSAKIRADKISFDKPRVVVDDGLKYIMFKSHFEDPGGEAKKLGDAGTIPK